MRAYNKNLDEYYSPDDTPELYLTDEQINGVLNSLPHIDKPAEINVREAIKEIETINREEKLGNILPAESSVKIRNISNGLLQKYGFWPYVTKTFELFYKSFEQ
ncbi:MAG: hypothetical protein LBT00_04980 [Spirochaetaceae bacterium]|jgi:hypothetical protein|nr:hypothetical protein [Spirochaetaceae bacterium]